MDNFAKGLVADIGKVTEKWRKQNLREIREAGARSRRREAFVRPPHVTIQQAAWRIMPAAYAKASRNGTLPVQPRQIMYAARGYIQDQIGRKLDDRYFTQTLLPDYVALNEVDWDIVWNARGSLYEPHTSRHVPLGTLEVREYLDGRESIYLPPDFTGGWHTTGHKHRYGAVLFVEKEGFLPLFRKVKLAERYDIAIMSTKGVSTTAARTLIDTMVEDGVPVFCARDFDLAGFTIAGTLGRDTRRYSWVSSGAVDLGLRLSDVQAYDLESEDVYYRGANGRLLDNNHDIRLKIKGQLEEDGATAEEINFLLRHRVELNAFTSDKLIEWIEGKLVEHGVGKVVPEPETLEQAARGFARDIVASNYLETFASDIDRDVARIDLNKIEDEVARAIEAPPRFTLRRGTAADRPDADGGRAMSAPTPERTPPRLVLPGPPDNDTRMRAIRATCVATAERWPDCIPTVDVYLGDTWPGREWDGSTVEKASLAAAEFWRTEGEA